MEKKYKKHELRTHIYEIPDTYIGSTELTQLEIYLYDNDSKRMIKKTITYVPGLYKIFDETIVNALDQITRLKQSELKQELENIRHVKNIKITIERDTGFIEIENDGDGIDVDILPNEGGIYIPQMLFGELLTSSNYTEKDVEKLVGGKGGFGGKLTNIFSLEFTAETVDHRRKKIYTQKWTDNMKNVEKPVIKSYSKLPYTKIRFLPDYKRFGLDGLTDDIYDLFYKRTLDACATSDPTVNIFFNGTKLDTKNFEKYADLYLGTKTDTPRVYESCDRWEVIAAPNTSSQFEQISFVNGINTIRGGKHVDYIKNQITKKLVEMAESKKKTVKANHIADNLFLIVKCLIVNPSFDTQTKEFLTTPISKFGSKCELSDKFFTGLFKSGIIEKAAKLTDFHQDKKAAKTDGKKTSRIYIDKLDDANDAGTKNSSECTLILTEGDSAKALAIAGLSVVGRQKFGVYPLRGKILNVDDASAQKIADNKEITELKKILGLQNGKVYKDKSETRYGRILAFVDQDTDGSHIKGLLFNLFYSLWPSLYKMEDFLVSLKTPLMKAFHTNGQVMQFYNLYEAESWIENKKKSATGLKGWTFKYYKGLGTSTSAEAKEYFKDLKMTKYKYTGKESDEAMSLAFNKKRADDRKEWLMKFDPNNSLDYQNPDVPYEDFINKEMILYSEEDLVRSINHAIDFLKESQRKILYSAFKRKLYNKEMKVAQFAAYTADVSDYHHGENSLNIAITAMAQNFVGSNNINLFSPNGQFGTRIQGGSDASASRYIFTLLTDLALLIYRKEDFKVLEYNTSDGKKIEPKYYIPVIPMLVNGATGIGTGFSTNLPNYNPSDVIAHCKVIAELIEQDPNIVVDDIELAELIPWYLGFKGKIVAKEGKEGVFESHGVYTWIKDDLIEVTELPIGTWTEDYKDFLTKCVVGNNPVLKDFESHYTETNVKFLLKLYPGVRAGIEMNFNTEFKLVSTKNLNTNNIHLITEDGTIKKFSGTTEIIKRFAKIRLDTYERRKNLELKLLRKQEQIISAKVKFIKEYIEGIILLAGKNIAEVEAQLKKLEYPMSFEENDDEEEESRIKIEPSFDYLTDMPLKTLTNEKKKALEKQEENIKMKIKELDEKSITSMWIDELNEIEAAWNKFRKEIEESQKNEVSVNKGKGKKK